MASSSSAPNTSQATQTTTSPVMPILTGVPFLSGPSGSSGLPGPSAPQYQGASMGINDSVLGDDVAASTVGRNIVLPQDEQVLAASSDWDLANWALILGMRASTVLSHMARRLCTRSLEAQGLNQDVAALRLRVAVLEQEKKQLKMETKQLKRQKTALEYRLAHQQGQNPPLEVSTREVAERDTWLTLGTQGDAGASGPSGPEMAEETAKRRRTQPGNEDDDTVAK